MQATEPKTMFNIPAENMKKFEEQIAKLSRKSEKLIGMPIKHVVFGYEVKKLSDGHTHKVFQVYLTADMPVINGWAFVARIDHSQETGNLIRSVPNLDFNIPEKYRTAKPCCDHCNVNRYRRDTFLVRNIETGEFKQVGKSCLIDFFGHDVSSVAQYAEFLSSANIYGMGCEQIIGADRRFVEVEEFLRCAAVAIRINGKFISRKAVRESSDYDLIATADYAHKILVHPLVKPRNPEEAITEADIELAHKAREWALGFENKADLSDYEHNVLMIAINDMMEYRAEGIAASIIGGYLRSLELITNVGDLEMIATLEANLDKLSAKDRSFATSLISSVKARKSATEKQAHWLKELTKKAVKAEDKVGDIANITKMIEQSKLSRPVIVLELPNGQGVKVTKASQYSANAGFLYVKGRNGTYYGKISPDGVFSGNEASAKVDVVSALKFFAADPAGVAAAYGKKTGECCFCCRPLSDARSVHVGYGETCAHNYGLPWGDK